MGIDQRYCGNLYCNLTIQPCSTGFGYLNLFVSQNFETTTILDVFKIISNDETILKIDETNRELKEFGVYLDSSNLNELEVFTSYTVGSGYFEMFYQPFTLPPSDVHIYLTSNSSYNIFDLRLQILPIIEISDTLMMQACIAMLASSPVKIFPYLFFLNKSQNLRIFIYRFRKDFMQFSIFNNQSLTYNLNGGRNCFKSNNPYKCEINNTKIALFQDPDDPYNEIVAVRLSDPFDGCFFSETVFSTKGKDTVNIAALAIDKGICDIILFNDPDNFYIISSLWTTSKIDTVKMFIGLDKKRLYFEFNSKSTKKWRNIGIMSHSYIKEIPKNSALFLKLKAVEMDPTLVLEYPYHSMITTNDFGTSKSFDDTGPINIYYVCNATMKFTAIYYRMALHISFYFLTFDYMGNNKKVFYINKTGDSVIFHDSVVALVYSYIIDSDEAMFYIETIN